MSFVRNLYADLVEKRLWPLAAALLVALVAVPVILSKPAKESSSVGAPAAGSPALGASSAAILGETKPIVTLGGDGGFRKHIARLARKNPFVQQATGGSATKSTGQNATVEPSGTTGSGTTTAPVSTPGGNPTTGGGEPQKLYRYVAKVKFGRISQTKSKTVEPAEFLPSEQNPALLFLGADDSGDNALFLVSPDATARGDGVCVPSESDCQIVRMKKDDVEFFEVSLSAETVITYELELVDIALREVKSPPSTTQGTAPRLELRLNSRRLKRTRQAMRSKRVFQALDQLGF
jgi:hypothetical protein